MQSVEGILEKAINPVYGLNCSKSWRNHFFSRSVNPSWRSLVVLLRSWTNRPHRGRGLIAGAS